MTLSGARCVVLGAGGFIGINLCRGLLAAGAVVTGFGRAAHDRVDAIADIAWRHGDFEDEAAMAAAVRGQDVVFHLLGGSVPASSNEDPCGDIMGSLLPSLRLIQACRAGGAGRLVFASSGGTVYGPTPAVPVTEAAATNPITAYGINKLAVEKYLGLFRHLHAFDAVVLRIANPYGPYQHRRRAQGVVGTALARAIAGQTIEIWGDGSVVRDYIHIDDVVSALIATATGDGREWLFNLGSGQARSVREVVADICVVTGTPLDRIRHHAGRAADIPYNVLDSGLLTRATGWRPAIAWEDGLAGTAAWMRANAATT